MSLEILTLLLLLCLGLTLASSWKAQVKIVLGVLLIIALYFYSWCFFPFSSERWNKASLFERRLLARNFLNTHEYLTLNREEIERLFGAADDHDHWIYYLSYPEQSPDFDGLAVEFQKGRVLDVHQLFSRSTSTRGEFSQAKWREGDKKGRTLLATDLVESKFLEGKTKEEVLIALGRPDEFSRLFYDLGMFAWLIELDSYSLDFEIDEHGNVIRADIYQN